MPLEIPQLPVVFMNDDHAHAADQLATMQVTLRAYSQNRTPLVLASQAFLEHNRAHFAREEAAMLATHFPPYSVHKSEHERVLAWLADLVANIESGLEQEPLRQAVEETIPAWFVQHIQTMDTATAHWIASHS